MSQDSRSLEMAPPQMDTLLHFGHKKATLVILDQKATHSLVSSPGSLLETEIAPYEEFITF